MRDTHPFEESIRSKLSSLETPYSEEFWKGYQQLKRKKKGIAGILLPWFPYLLFALLFGFTWTWIYTHRHGNTPQTGMTTDTVYIHTVIHKTDTVIVRDTLVLFSLTDTQFKSMSETKRTGYDINSNDADKDSKRMLRQSDQSSKKQQESDLLSAVDVTGTKHELPSRASQTTSESLATPNAGDKPTGNSDSSTELSLIKPDDSKTDTHEVTAAQVQSDSLDEMPLENSPSKPNLQSQFRLGLSLQGYQQLSENHFETALAGAGGVEAGFSLSRIGLYTGISAGTALLEIDDTELMPANLAASYPGNSFPANRVDDIVIRSRHLIIPAGLYWSAYRNRKFTLSTYAGVWANAVRKERFVYVLDQPNESEVDYVFKSRSFQMSHIHFGIGTGYTWGNNWFAESRVQLNHPLRPIGISQQARPLIGLQIGIYRIF